MKTDRLYAITVYLLNHGKTSAKDLAGRFEVSVRTIQRDIDSLCVAGIPIVAESGANGGYYLTESFKMNAQTATEEEYLNILTALKGYSTAMNNPHIDTARKIIIVKIIILSRKREILFRDFLLTGTLDKSPV